VAALFALHPLHVEAVAWISDRKGVLSTTFWMLTCLAYVRYVRVKSKVWYFAAIACLALGLMAKPVVITLPFVLLFLDAWPMKRFEGGLRPFGSFLAANKGIFIEKVPLILVALASAVVTYLVQQRTGAVRTYDEIPLFACVANAAISYPAYIVQTFWPVDLAFLYPHPREAVMIWLAVVSVAGLVAVSLAAWFFRHRFPAGFVGWFWFIGTLVPMIGIIQFGQQARADRFTYVPLIGFFIIVVWGAAALVGKNSVRRKILFAVGCVVLIACGVLTQAQVKIWKDSETLYRRAIEVTKDNFVAHSMLGNVLMVRNDFAGAERQYVEALRIHPEKTEVYVNLGRARLKLGKVDEAIADLKRATEAAPDDAQTHTHLGLALIKKRNTLEAEDHFRRAVDLDPDAYLARFNLGVLLINTRRYKEAVEQLTQAVRIDPQNPKARDALNHARSKMR
jgi:Flp pilus assembly protein TadD